jgi:lipopolysaccharide biosynthesis regulator YciM
MDFDISWILLGLPVAFTLGWLASRVDLRHLRFENRQAPKAYFRGLNFLLNEQQDQAIDAFIEAVQRDPDTSELHFALGNLFRRRGEYERAVRVHEHLLQRGDLPQPDRDRAQHALALDYLKAGLLDRAENALRKLEGTAFEEEARLALLSIYERSRDWEHASQIASQLGGAGHGSFTGRQAHYLCEQASALVASGQANAAISLLERACQLAPSAARPLIDLAKLHHQSGQTQTAFDDLLTLEQTAPQSFPLATSLMVSMAEQHNAFAAPIFELLKTHYQHTPSVDVMQALATLETDPTESRQTYIDHLESEASLVAATRWIAGENLGTENQNKLLKRALDLAAQPLMRYRCAACGFEASQHYWHCPGCQAWDSYPARRVEEL